MNHLPIDPIIADWLDNEPVSHSGKGLERALVATGRIQQRPGWTFARRWLPPPVADVQLTVPLPASVGLILLLTLMLVIALAAAIVASRPPPLRLPLGPSAESLIAYQDGPAIFVAHMDGSGRRILSNGVDHAQSPVFSPDGSRVAFVALPTADALAGRLLVVPVDGSGAAIEVSAGVEVAAGSSQAFSWSPDGTQLAFTGLRSAVSTIFVAASDGSGVTAVTDERMPRDLPSWSTDGDWIAYRAIEPDGLRRHLEMVRPDGSEVQQVTTVVATDANLSRLDWSPVNDSLVYAMNVGFATQTRVVIDLRFGHSVEPWSDGVGGYVDAGIPFSPDGQSLAILTANDGVIVADYDPTSPDYEGERRRLGPIADCWIDWSPDGTALYGGSPDGCTAVVVIPLANPEMSVTLPLSGVASWQPGSR